MAFTIKKVSVFVAVDKDGEEGVIGMQHGNVLLPMVCADERRIESLRPIAKEIGRSKNMTVKLIQFDNRQEIEIIHQKKGIE